MATEPTFCPTMNLRKKQACIKENGDIAFQIAKLLFLRKIYTHPLLANN